MGFIMVKMVNNDCSVTKKLVRVEEIKSITQRKKDDGCILDWSGGSIHVLNKFDELSQTIALASEKAAMLSKGDNIKIEVR